MFLIGLQIGQPFPSPITRSSDYLTSTHIDSRTTECCGINLKKPISRPKKVTRIVICFINKNIRWHFSKNINIKKNINLSHVRANPSVELFRLSENTSKYSSLIPFVHSFYGSGVSKKCFQNKLRNKSNIKRNKSMWSALEATAKYLVKM